jgi:hypothetical protein
MLAFILIYVLHVFQVRLQQPGDLPLLLRLPHHGRTMRLVCDVLRWDSSCKKHFISRMRGKSQQKGGTFCCPFARGGPRHNTVYQNKTKVEFKVLATRHLLQLLAFTPMVSNCSL